MKDSKKKPANGFNMSRRSFLKVSTIVGAGIMAGAGVTAPEIMCAVSPKKKNPEPLMEKWVATSCLNCSTGCATRIRVVNGKAVWISGNPLSRTSEGKTCPRAQIGLQVLYDPDRIKTPLKRTQVRKGKGIDPQWTPISWEAALEEVDARLKALRDQGQPHKLLLLQGLNTASDQDLIFRFAKAYGTPNLISGEALENEAEKAGRWMADGHYQAIAYDLPYTNYILAFGAGILESQKPLSRNLRMWGKIRRERPNRVKVVVIDPRLSVTADKADEWITIEPGTDGALAMAMANVIISEGLYDAPFVQNRTAGFAEFEELALRHYSAERAAEITGVRPDLIRRIAREFAQTRPAIAWAGNGVGRWPNGSYSSYAIYSLNALVGSIDVPGGVIYQENPPYRDLPKVVEDRLAKEGKEKPPIDFHQTEMYPAAKVVTNQVAESILKETPYPIEAAIGFNCNFNSSAPGTWVWNEALSKVPYYVHIAPHHNEMSEYANILLPSSSFLEEWAYDHCTPGPGFAEVHIKQPAVETVSNSKPVADLVFELAHRQGGTVGRSFADIGGDIQGFVRYRTEPLIPWKEFCEKGVWTGSAYRYYKYDRIFKTPSKKFEFCSGNLEKLWPRKEKAEKSRDRLQYLPHHENIRFLGDPAKYPLLLLTYQPLLHMGAGSQNYPWAQSIFLVMHGIGWTNFAELNSETAKAMRIKDGDLLWVESSFKKIMARARVDEGVHPGVVCIARGQGHTAYGRWSKGIGVNPQDIIGVDYDRLSGQAVFSNTRVKVYKA
jgi:anaerobic selenocysteine-containing dehydrogenase